MVRKIWLGGGLVQQDECVERFMRIHRFSWQVHQLQELSGLVAGYRLGWGVADRIVWEPSVMGEFSVKELSTLMHSFDISVDTMGAFRVWDVDVPHKMRCFLWFVLLGRLSTLVGVVWIPPVARALKFNVDGAAHGKPGAAGCGGVLRDSDGRVLACFSWPLGTHESNEAELRAIDFALDFLLSSKWCSVGSIIIESDLVTVVSWILHRERRSWLLAQWFRRIDFACLRIFCVCFNNVLRKANGMADVLAKAGVSRRDWLCFCEGLSSVGSAFVCWCCPIVALFFL
ncbi:hypothetical protein GQ457_03G012910 [Hibiscus cannabinus]